MEPLGYWWGWGHSGTMGGHGHPFSPATSPWMSPHHGGSMNCSHPLTSSPKKENAALGGRDPRLIPNATNQPQGLRSAGAPHAPAARRDPETEDKGDTHPKGTEILGLPRRRAAPKLRHIPGGSRLLSLRELLPIYSSVPRCWNLTRATHEDPCPLAVTHHPSSPITHHHPALVIVTQHHHP